MPSKLRRLKQEAIKSCQFRKHNMSNFYYVEGVNVYRSICNKCNKYVDVNLNPKPNEIEIGGTAISLDCNDHE